MFIRLCADIEERGGDDWFFEELAATGKVPPMARELGVSRQMLYKWRNRSEERRSRWEEAMKDGAVARLDEADEIMDGLKIDGTANVGEVQARNSKANYAIATAKLRNPERFDKARFPRLQLFYRLVPRLSCGHRIPIPETSKRGCVA